MKWIIDGFHLIEVLFVLTIISVTIAFSYPLFSDYLIEVKRAEAKLTLIELALALENFHASHATYAHASLFDLQFKEMIAKKSYHLAIQHATQSEFLITATPIGKQSNDKECAVLSLRSNNQKGISGYGHIDKCWN